MLKVHSTDLRSANHNQIEIGAIAFPSTTNIFLRIGKTEIWRGNQYRSF